MFSASLGRASIDAGPDVLVDNANTRDRCDQLRGLGRTHPVRPPPGTPNENDDV